MATLRLPLYVTHPANDEPKPNTMPEKALLFNERPKAADVMDLVSVAGRSIPFGPTKMPRLATIESLPMALDRRTDGRKKVEPITESTTHGCARRIEWPGCHVHAHAPNHSWTFI